MTDWYVGQKVVAIAERRFWLTGTRRHRIWLFWNRPYVPSKGRVHKIARISVIGAQTFFDLEGYLGCKYWDKGFRPLVEPKTDISVFTSMLDRLNERKRRIVNA